MPRISAGNDSQRPCVRLSCGSFIVWNRAGFVKGGAQKRGPAAGENRGSALLWLLNGLDGTCKSVSGQVAGGECLLGEGTVVILQELVELFHIRNFLSVEEDDFDGSGFLISQRCDNILSGTRSAPASRNY